MSRNTQKQKSSGLMLREERGIINARPSLIRPHHLKGGAVYSRAANLNSVVPPSRRALLIDKSSRGGFMLNSHTPDVYFARPHGMDKVPFPKDSGSYYDTNYATKNVNLRKPRFLGALLGGLQGRPAPNVQDSRIRFTTFVSNEQQFRSSLQSMNESINQQILSASTTAVTNVSQLSQFNIVGMTAEELNIDFSNQQQLTFFNVSEMNVQAVNSFIVSQSQQITDEILTQFESTQLSDFQQQARANSQNSIASNLIGGLLGKPAEPGTNIKSAIEQDSTLRVAYSSERQELFSNLMRNENIQNFAQNIRVALSQEFGFNLQDINIGGRATVIVSNQQNIDSVLKIVTRLDLASKVLNNINTSSSFAVDQSVINTAQNVARTSSDQTQTNEGISDVIDSAGTALSGVVDSAGNAVSSTVGALGGALAIPLAIGVVAVGALAYFYLRGTGIIKKPADENVNSAATTFATPSNSRIVKNPTK
jgi:hypothetical protein